MAKVPVKFYGQFALDVLERAQRILRSQPKVTVQKVLKGLPLRVPLPHGKTIAEAAEEVLRADARFSVRNFTVERGFDYAQPNLEVRAIARNMKEN